MITDKQPENSVKRGENLKPYRWKKGQPSPNPNGRPKGKTLTEMLRLLLDKVGEEARDGETYTERIAKVFVHEALKGKFPFAKEIIDRIDGKVPDRIADAEGKTINVILRVPRPPNEFK